MNNYLKTEMPVTDTGVEVRVFCNGKFVGESGLLSNGHWETHPTPVECSPWAYHANADDAVHSLLRYAGVGGGYVKEFIRPLPRPE